MKSIMLSIKPKWVCKILNGNKTIEIRKKFPKDYVGWVYIYCTKEKPNLWLPYEYDCFETDEASQPYLSDEPLLDIDTKLNGKVVARFWCDKVSEWHNYSWQEITKNACITDKELQDYSHNVKSLWCIHITKLEIFDKPREIGEFTTEWKKRIGTKNEYTRHAIWKAPQSWCFIGE